MQAIWNNVVIAESDDTVVVENNHYFPASALRDQYFTPSGHQTACHWKGIAHYYSVTVNGQTNDNAAWYYPEPKAAATEIKDRVAFWKGVAVVASS